MQQSMLSVREMMRKYVRPMPVVPDHVAVNIEQSGFHNSREAIHHLHVADMSLADVTQRWASAPQGSDFSRIVFERFNAKGPNGLSVYDMRGYGDDEDGPIVGYALPYRNSDRLVAAAVVTINEQTKGLAIHSMAADKQNFGMLAGKAVSEILHTVIQKGPLFMEGTVSPDFVRMFHHFSVKRVQGLSESTKECLRKIPF
jgi:hypothetical protein